MGEHTKIEWATHTLNFWEGCTKVSEGCQNCYAAARDLRFHGGEHWGPGAPRRVTSPATWLQADRWNREAEMSGRRPRVFVNSLSDIFDPEVPGETLAQALENMRRNPCCDFLLVTKRPELWLERMGAAVAALILQGKSASWLFEWRDGKPPENIWVGTTVENQPRADERIHALLAIPARVRFLSAEPLLGPVDLTGIDIDADGCGRTDALRGATFSDGRNSPISHARIDWVIVGGESGTGARPMHPDWARSLRDQCASAGVPFFFKQWGVWAPHYAKEHETHGCDDGCRLVCPKTGEMSEEAPANEDHEFMWPHRKKQTSGRLLDGVEHNAIPEVRR